MSKPRLKVEYMSWSSIVEAVAWLSKKIATQYKPDLIVAIAKGGLIPARILADILGIEDLGYIEVKFYKSIGSTLEKPFIKTMALQSIVDKNVLVVDDIVDSGRTMQLVVNVLSNLGARTVKSAALYVKPWSTYTPDYYYKVVTSWIVFPWEVCEVLKEGVSIDHSEFKKLVDYCVVK